MSPARGWLEAIDEITELQRSSGRRRELRWDPRGIFSIELEEVPGTTASDVVALLPGPWERESCKPAARAAREHVERVAFELWSCECELALLVCRRHPERGLSGLLRRYGERALFDLERRESHDAIERAAGSDAPLRK